MMIVTFDFEGSLEDGRWYVHPSGCGLLPKGWKPFYTEVRTEPWQNFRPEYGYPERHDPQWEYRRRSGEKSFGWGSDWHTHNGGSHYLFHQDGLTGKRVRFSVWGYYLVGGTGSDNPAHPGATNDRIGVDPSGFDPIPGDVPLGLQIVWAAPAENLVRGYTTVPEWVLHQVETVAQDDVITLFLYSAPEWAGIRTSGPVWDEAILEIIEDGECWGQPRIQYKRIYNVISSVEEAHRVLDLVGLQTIGPSSDDAGMGMLDDKTAVEWNRPQDVQENYREFHATHYPRAKVQFKSFDGEEPELALWSQRDPRWRDYIYGGGMTLGVSGCLVTCIAMLTGDEPPACARKLADAGVLEGSYVSRPAKIIEAYPDLSYGGTVHWRDTAADLEMLAAWLEDGPVVIETEFSPGGAVPPTDQHFVIALELDGDDLIIADPWTGEIARLLARYARDDWSLQRAVYGVRLFGHIPEGPQEPLEPIYHSLVGLHEQRGVPGIDKYIFGTQTSVYKTVLSFQNCRAIKELSPNTLTVIRPYPNNVTGKGAVEAVIDGIADDLAVLHPWLNYVGLINEQVPSGNDGAIIEAIDTEIWGMHALKNLGYPVKPLILNVAIGNPWGPWDPHDQQPLLVKAVQASFDLFGDCTIGYHGYWPSNRTFSGVRFADVNGVRTDVGKYYSFRWQEWDKEFAKHGLRPKYINTEMGVIGTHGPRADGYIDTLPNDGWRSSNGLGGDRVRLMDELAQWQAECAAWNETHGNRMLGGNFFTTGGGSKWSGFEFGDREMQAWATRLGM